MISMISRPGSFWEWLPQPNGGDFTAILMFSIGAIIGITILVTSAVVQIHKNKVDDALKRELLDRGLSADEIATVLNAGQQKCRSLWKSRREVS